MRRGGDVVNSRRARVFRRWSGRSGRRGATSIATVVALLAATSASAAASKPSTSDDCGRNRSATVATAPIAKSGSTRSGNGSGGKSDDCGKTTKNAPTVTSVVPPSGPQAGGTVVTVSGTNLRGASKVQFGAGHTAGAFTVNSAGTVITVTAPAGTGVVDVIVTTGSGASAATPFDRFTYVPPGPYDGATLTLSPSSSGPDVPHTTQSLTATLQDRSGHALPDMPVAWTVGGANHASGTAATDATGVAHFSYTGTLSGADTVTAQVAAGRSPISSNPATVTWAVPTAPLASLSTSSVSGSFFAESPSATAFVAKPGDLAAFAESFPDITFNPPASTVPHDTSKVGPATVPFTDVTTDGLGNFTGTRAAQGNGLAAGAGALTAFDAEFEGTFTVAAAGQETLAVAHDDGFILGVGGGATKVSGPAIGAPATTPFKGYAVMGAVNQVEAAPLTDTVVVNFPAAGTYSYELDYLQRTATMSLVLGFPGAGGGGGGGGGGGSSLTISAAYAYGAGTGANFPTPWSGSPGVTFSGSAAAPYDTGALRFDNTGASTVQL